MKRVLKKLISIMLIIILLGSLEAPSIYQTVIAVSEYATSNGNYEEEDIFRTVFNQGEVENIIPFIFKNYNDSVSKEYIINQFEKAGKTITNKDEIQNPVGTGTKIKTYSETYTVLVYGDVDGDGEVSAFDAQEVLRHDVGMNNHILTGIYEIAGNVYNDDDITDTFDAQRILRFSVGYESVPVILYILPVYPTPTPVPTSTPAPTSNPDPGPRPTSTPAPQEELVITAELENKDKYYYIDEHTITVNAKNKETDEKVPVTSATVTVLKEDGKKYRKATITKVPQEDGSMTVTFSIKEAGKYTIRIKVGSNEIEKNVTIEENTNVSEVIFGTEASPINSLTVTNNGVNKEVPLIFKNSQGIVIEIDSSRVTTEPQTTGGITTSTDGKKLIVSATQETEATSINVLVDGKVVGTITINAINVITSVKSEIKLGASDAYYREEQYEVVISLNGKESTIYNPDQITLKVYNESNRTTSNATVTKVATTNDGVTTYKYYFKATKAGKYKVIATVNKDDSIQQPQVDEAKVADKDVIEVFESNKVNKIIIGSGTNKVEITPEGTTGKIELYNGEGLEQTLPVTFKHKYTDNTEVDVNEVRENNGDNKVSGNDITIEGITDKIQVAKRGDGVTEVTTGEFKNLYLAGLGEEEGEVVLTFSANGTQVGELTISLINPRIKIAPVGKTVEFYIGYGDHIPSRDDLFPDDYDEIFTYTLFTVSKVDKNGKEIGKVNIEDIANFQRAVSDGEDTLTTDLVPIVGIKDGEIQSSGEMTHLGITIDDMPVNDAHKATNQKVLNNIKAKGAKFSISYKGLKTATGEEQYTYENVKVIKPISQITSSVSKGTDKAYYKEEKYEVSVTLGANEELGNSNTIEWKVYNAETKKPTTDATVTTEEATTDGVTIKKYYFKATKVGKYKVIASIKEQPAITEKLEEKEEVIDVVENNKVNKIVIGSGTNKVEITPEGTTGKIELYNGEGFEQTLPVTFKHKYTDNTEVDVNEISVNKVSGNDITIEGITDKIKVAKRGDGVTEVTTGEFKNLYLAGLGEAEDEVVITFNANNTKIGELTISLLNPRIKIAPVGKTVEFYLGYGDQIPSRDDLFPDDYDEIFTYTLFTVSKVDKNGKEIGKVNIEDIAKFQRTVSDGEDTLTTDLLPMVGIRDGQIQNSGEMTYLGITIDDLITENQYAPTNRKVLNNLKTKGGKLTISYTGLKTATGEEQYTYENVRAIKPISKITSSVSKGKDDKYYKEGKYEVSVTLGENEELGENNTIEWTVYNAETKEPTTDATVTTEEATTDGVTTKKYYFEATKVGKYKVIASIKEQPAITEKLEEKEEVIDVVENNKVNKIVIGSGDNKVEITPEGTKGKIELYNGEEFEQTLPVTFKHQYKDKTEVDVNEVRGNNGDNKVSGNDITIEGITDKIKVAKRGDGVTEVTTGEFKNLYLAGLGKEKGEVVLTFSANGTQVGELTISLVNPRIKITPVGETVEFYLGYGDHIPSRDDLFPDDYDEIFTYTLFTVSKVDESGKEIEKVDISDIAKLKITVGDGEDTLSTTLVPKVGIRDGAIQSSGEMTYLGITIDDVPANDEYKATNQKVLNNIKASGGVLNITFEGLETEKNYSYKFTVK